MLSMIAFATPTETLEKYYSEFQKENIDGYMETLYLEGATKEIYDGRKTNVLQIWDSLDTLDYNLLIFSEDIDEDISMIEYEITSVISDGKDKETYSMSMTAILYKEENDWKVYMVTPTKILETNLELMMLNSENKTENNKTEEKMIEKEDNETEDESSEPVEKGRTYLKCNYDTNDLTNMKDQTVESSISTLIGNDKIVKVVVDSNNYYFKILNGKANSIKIEKYDYEAVLSSCTLDRIQRGASIINEYNEGNIKLKGHTFGNKIKTTLAKIAINVYGWFKSNPVEIWVEAETGELYNARKYSEIGSSSRGPGELYLGDGGSYAIYNIKSKKDVDVILYIFINDDGKHPDGARNAEFTINDQSLVYNHKSKNIQHDGNYWEKFKLGKVHLNKGKNVVKISKTKSTSAAFIMDKMLFIQE